MGNRGAKIGGPDSSTTKLNTTPLGETTSTSEVKHSEEFKFFDKALKVVDAERKTKLRKKFRDLVKESKTATIKWQNLPELYDDSIEKWKHNYFNALRCVIKTIVIAYDNRNPKASYEDITNLINLCTLVIDYRKTVIKTQERKRKNTTGLQTALAEWNHAHKKLRRILLPKEPKASTSGTNGNGNVSENGEE